MIVLPFEDLFWLGKGMGNPQVALLNPHRFSYGSIVAKWLRARARGYCCHHCCHCVNIVSTSSPLHQHCVSMPLCCCGVGEGGGQGSLTSHWCCCLHRHALASSQSGWERRARVIIICYCRHCVVVIVCITIVIAIALTSSSVSPCPHVIVKCVRWG